MTDIVTEQDEYHSNLVQIPSPRFPVSESPSPRLPVTVSNVTLSTVDEFQALKLDFNTHKKKINEHTNSWFSSFDGKLKTLKTKVNIELDSKVIQCLKKTDTIGKKHDELDAKITQYQTIANTLLENVVTDVNWTKKQVTTFQVRDYESNQKFDKMQTDNVDTLSYIKFLESRIITSEETSKKTEEKYEKLKSAQKKFKTAQLDFKVDLRKEQSDFEEELRKETRKQIKQTMKEEMHHLMDKKEEEMKQSKSKTADIAVEDEGGEDLIDIHVAGLRGSATADDLEDFIFRRSSVKIAALTNFPVFGGERTKFTFVSIHRCDVANVLKLDNTTFQDLKISVTVSKSSLARMNVDDNNNSENGNDLVEFYLAGLPMSINAVEMEDFIFKHTSLKPPHGIHFPTCKTGRTKFAFVSVHKRDQTSMLKIDGQLLEGVRLTACISNRSRGKVDDTNVIKTEPKESSNSYEMNKLREQVTRLQEDMSRFTHQKGKEPENSNSSSSSSSVLHEKMDYIQKNIDKLFQRQDIQKQQFDKMGETIQDNATMCHKRYRDVDHKHTSLNPKKINDDLYVNGARIDQLQTVVESIPDDFNHLKMQIEQLSGRIGEVDKVHNDREKRLLGLITSKANAMKEEQQLEDECNEQEAKRLKITI